ncbi:ABC transporter substrate-binding protein [Methylobacterium nodulans]|uniref:Extracellular solute-binding protein family 1 n=1 Tax=Methylobacterium nodulans (strain LMG 21967 / CNCM I-2342 / ORS 2060) TaxID=460265 RepID=B8ICI3_METNO|nr:extracellular solute-binding protein [Methylobacterium nodulans]ACL55571.1 extracellular solute-binding protein family 1 [Methylobacterium nodulans ORS 2060]
MAVSMRRRSFLGGLAVSGVIGAGHLDVFARAWAETAEWKPEPNASLSLLRWKRFVPSEDEAFMRLVDAFIKATGVRISVTNESYDDIQPKASVAANTGQGPDLVWGLYSFPALFPSKCLPVDDVAASLERKYGPWLPAAAAYGRIKGRWLAIPVAFTGSGINYRISSLKKAGFSSFPANTEEFLELCKGLKRNNTPAGMALGHATGDANSWLHWALWAHGGGLVDRNEKIVINSPETTKSLEYVKALYETFIPGTVSWNDSSNNKAFLAGDLHLTVNGVSIYATAKTDNPRIAEDMDHAPLPIGPAGKPTEFTLAFPILAYTYTKAPNACKAFMAFMMDAANYCPWLNDAQGYLVEPLSAYPANPVWAKDPKLGAIAGGVKRSLAAGGSAPVSERIAAALAEFIVVDMYAGYCTGREDVRGAMRMAERSAQRIFRNA